MMRKIFATTVIAVALAGSPAMAKKAKNMTPMELQSIQSKEFETTKDVAFGAVMTVIQDLGYTIVSADVTSGFITANSPSENKTGFFDALAGASASGNTVMTATLLPMPSKATRIRLNFVNSRNLSSAYGNSQREDKPILDAAVYTNAWNRIDETLFVMGALAESAPALAPAATSVEQQVAAPAETPAIVDVSATSP